MSSIPPPLTQGPPPLNQAPPPGWWSRNWKWAVPAFVAAFLAMIAGFIFLLFTTIIGFIKSSEPFKEAMSRANASQEVQAALGTPIESGFFVTGNVATTGSGGSAVIFIPISGPKGEGSLHVRASKSAGTWTYTALEAQTPGQPGKIDLRP